MDFVSVTVTAGTVNSRRRQLLVRAAYIYAMLFALTFCISKCVRQSCARGLFGC